MRRLSSKRRSAAIGLLLGGLLCATAGCGETPKPRKSKTGKTGKTLPPLKRPTVRPAPQRDELVQAIEDTGGDVEQALTRIGAELFRNAQTKRIEYVNLAGKDVTAEGLKQLLRLKDSLQRIGLNETHTTDDMLAVLADFKKLTKVELNQTAVTDAGLAHLKALPRLRELELRATNIGDEGLMHVGQMTELRMLSLSWTKITDAGLAHLSELDKLHTLILDDTGITDAGLPHLRDLRGLRFLHVIGTKITPSAAQQFARAAPGVQVRGP